MPAYEAKKKDVNAGTASNYSSLITVTPSVSGIAENQNVVRLHNPKANKDGLKSQKTLTTSAGLTMWSG